jgi:hypothetical protein
MVEYLYSFQNLQEASGLPKCVDVTLTATNWQKASRETIHVDFSILPSDFSIDLDSLTEKAMIELVELVIGDEMTRIKTELKDKLTKEGDDQ